MATIVSTRSPLFYEKVAGAMAYIRDIMTQTGNIFLVDGNAANASDTAGYGTEPDAPFATIDFAVGQCTANQGDVILVFPGHVETISAAAGLDLDVAGIKIIGLGHGNDRPHLKLQTATTADIDVDAADIKLQNFRVSVDIDSLAVIFDVNAKRFTLEDVEFQETSAKQWLEAINLDGGAANAVDGATIRRCKAVQVTAGANRFIELAEVADEVTIEDCEIDGDFVDAGIHNPTGKVLTNLRIHRNIIRNRQTGDHAIELVSACTGEAVDNRLFGDTPASILDPGSLFCAGNKGGSAIDEPGFDLPLAVSDVTTNLIGVDDADNAAATTNVVANEDGSVLERLEQIQEATNKGAGTALAANESLVDVLYGANGIGTFPAAAAPANGVSIAEVLRDAWDALRNGTGGTEPGTDKSIIDAIGFDGAAAVASSAGMLRVMAGTTFMVKKTLTSSAVVQAGVDVTAVSTVGEVQIIDATLQTDGTGLAAGTNFTLETNNAKGPAVFLSTAVSGLGASALMDLDSASVTSKTVVLETGKKVVAKCTAADCTGAGTIDVYLICRRLADGAALTAAA